MGEESSNSERHIGEGDEPDCVGAPEPRTGLESGDRMRDGTVYAGISPDTGKPMYTTPADAPLTYTFNQAQKYAARLDAHGHQDWRVPTKSELNVLYNNRAAISAITVSPLFRTLIHSHSGSLLF